jgi:branched-chain amino acid transport system permease protein
MDATVTLRSRRRITPRRAATAGVLGAAGVAVLVFLLSQLVRDADLFLRQFMNGVGDGVIYASLALALVLIFRTTGILNFAQGEMALFSTYVFWKITTWDAMPVWAAILLTMVVSFVGGALVERIVIRPVEQSSPLVIVIVTIGLFLAFNALAQVFFGTDSQPLPRAYPFEIWELGPLEVRSDTAVLIGVLAAECALLYLVIQKTKLGLGLRAVASNPESARLVGISVGNMLMFGWAIAAAIGALAGMLIVPTTPGLNAGSMQTILVFGFAAAALGGFDSAVGAVVAGLIVGVANALTTEYVDWLDGIELVVPFGLILGVLLFRPQGLFGSERVERV